ncbi:MAG: bifunctional precorrin-2 dehydrogenase/sirohydrochlorin ferrochelatase [Desulfovibrionaceae bacterium]|nr:bifunctional precorrin-2 dehydrogenase/sirohydrochlorin ferrochelatase [Desulfovibrionaceae bacterium]
MVANDSAPAYPIFLSLAHCRCLVAGLGEVGQRKLAGLLACQPAAVLALDIVPYEALSPEAKSLLAHECVSYACRPCELADITSSDLVFAATGNPEENLRIADFCRQANVWCNCASAPEAGTVTLPAVARHEGLAVALSTGGASPALSRRWRHELENWLAPRARMVRFMRALRPLVLAMKADTRQNTALFRLIAASPLQEWLAAGKKAQCRQWLLKHLPATLHAHIAELLDDNT